MNRNSTKTYQRLSTVISQDSDLDKNSQRKQDSRLLPKRTTKQSQKLALFPGADLIDDGSDALPHVRTIQPDYLLTRLGRKWLPRVTAYCTAGAFRLDNINSHIQLVDNGFSVPKRYDEALYASYTPSMVNVHHSGIDLINLVDPVEQFRPVLEAQTDPTETDLFFEKSVDCFGNPLPQTISYNALAKRICSVGECFFFDYGVVVIWGLTEQEEKTILRILKPFEDEKLDTEDYLTEEFHFHYNTAAQPRIYNDVITLKNPSNSMIKLTISHAIAQSVKLALFEELIENTIQSTRHIPRILADTGKIQMTRKAINQKIGQLFIMRINVNLVSNVLDTPEIFWSEPALQPLYTAIRKYLEISQRVELLNQRVAVISDLLDMLKENLNSTHGEQLEWIVIILIAFEIIIGVAMILVDVYHTG